MNGNGNKTNILYVLIIVHKSPLPWLSDAEDRIQKYCPSDEICENESRQYIWLSLPDVKQLNVFRAKKAAYGIDVK